MRKILLTLRYDGTDYHGWQVQPNGITVQERLQDAVEAVFGSRLGVTGCSRTDSGVHAYMFCCHINVDSAIPCEKIVKALNVHLPFDIAVCDCIDVDGEFHARYSSKGKNYIYKMYDSDVRDPFLAGHALYYKAKLDAELMNEAARKFIGTHDFSSFCSSGSSVESNVRTVTESFVEREGKLVTFNVTANGFLYNMVRIMVGTLIRVSEGAILPDDIEAIIDAKNRSLAGPTAPAHGLYLNKVLY